jgi:hypothetical protein
MGTSYDELEQSRDIKLVWKLILKHIFNKVVMRMWTRFKWIRIGSCEEDSEPSGYVKYTNFFNSQNY